VRYGRLRALLEAAVKKKRQLKALIGALAESLGRAFLPCECCRGTGRWQDGGDCATCGGACYVVVDSVTLKERT